MQKYGGGSRVGVRPSLRIWENVPSRFGSLRSDPFSIMTTSSLTPGVGDHEVPASRGTELAVHMALPTTKLNSSTPPCHGFVVNPPSCPIARRADEGLTFPVMTT